MAGNRFQFLRTKGELHWSQGRVIVVARHSLAEVLFPAALMMLFAATVTPSEGIAALGSALCWLLGLGLVALICGWLERRTFEEELPALLAELRVFQVESAVA